MNFTILLFATMLVWIVVIAGLYQRIFQFPNWFENPPASFELIRKQGKSARMFWLPLFALLMLSLITSLVLNWQQPGVRSYIFATLACFGLTGALSGSYFIKEVIAFTKIPANVPQSPELLERTKFWLKWTTVRDVLQILAAIFITMAYSHL